MNVHLQREVEKLKKKILDYSAHVESSLHKAIKSLQERDVELAKQVIEYDDELDQLEVENEEDCLKILALHTPVANDLRFIIAVLKINNDLERIADQAANIASRVSALCKYDSWVMPVELNLLVEKSQAMLKKSLEALINLDVNKAKEVIVQDDEVDELHSKMYKIMEDMIRQNPEKIDCFINILTVSRNLERVADLVTNIAEDIIYMVKGVIVRHKM